MTDQPKRGGPDKCPRPCSVCEGDDHHWGYHDFAESEPEHPAAKAGHEVWDGCKHCDAWREVPDEEDDLGDEPLPDERLPVVRFATPPSNPDGFKLMKYRSDDGVDEEWIWNSRANVTPFVATLSNGKTAMHVDWHQDRYVPDYVPAVGSIVFVDATKERLRPKVSDYVDKFWDQAECPMRDTFKDKAEANAMLLKEWFGDGQQPLQYVVDEKFLKDLADARKNRN